MVSPCFGSLTWVWQSARAHEQLQWPQAEDVEQGRLGLLILAMAQTQASYQEPWQALGTC